MTFELTLLHPDDAHEFAGLTYNRYKHYLKNENVRSSDFFSIGARIHGIPVGLALCEILSEEVTELKSLFVTQEHRIQGLATRLLKKVESEAKKQGCTTLLVLYLDNTGGKIIKQLLKSGGYSSPEFASLVCRSRSRGKIFNAPFLKKSLLPPSCETFLWKDLEPQERSFILEKQQETPWYPPILSPFSNEKEIEYLNSLGLRYRGEIAGWVITHRISHKTIRYTTSFVRQDLQQYGFTAPLLIEAIKIHIASPESYVATDASFVIPVQFESMITLAKKRILPYMEESWNLYKSYKDLADKVI
ncbi:MAG: GNAT family N-acetyltransferase [Desulfobacterales bacterium]|nr:GNAT family N-acetyltransferase [Desulfobacterales bacterium]